MIEAKELRIGNLVSNIGQGLIRVLSIDEDNIYGKGVYSSDYSKIRELSHTYGIVLTEEWMLNLGFSKKINEEDFDYWVNGDFDRDFLWQHSEGFCYNFGKGYDLKYVHQLQNLFFALTNKELKFNKQE